VRDHNTQRTVVEQARRHRVLAAGHAHDAADAGIKAGRRHLGGNVERDRAVLEIDEHEIIAGLLKRTGYVGGTGQAHSASEAELALDQTVKCRVGDAFHVQALG